MGEEGGAEGILPNAAEGEVPELDRNLCGRGIRL
jgi:hypothetical protein